MLVLAAGTVDDGVVAAGPVTLMHGVLDASREKSGAELSTL